MDYFEVVTARHSIRTFRPTPVEDHKLKAILNAANSAPSAHNLQSYEIYQAGDPSVTAALAAVTYNQGFIAQAPVILVFCTHPARCLEKFGDKGAQLYSLQDATIACTFAMLAVTALDLASVWIGAFDPAGVQGVVGLPAGIVPIALLPIGYPAGEPELTTRRSLDELVHRIPV